MTSSDAGCGAGPLLAEPRRSGRALTARVLVITDGISLHGEPVARPPAAPGEPDPAALIERLSDVLSAVPAGSIAVQLRCPQAATAVLYRRACALRALTARQGAMLFINDRIDVALAVDADGVHLPGQGLPAHIARRFVGERLVLCAAAHSLAEARMLARAGADAVTLSPIWPTPSKPPLAVDKGGVGPLGLGPLSQAVQQLSVPVFALGGIDRVERVIACAAVGARVACLRALLSLDADTARAQAIAFVESAQAPVAV